MEKFKLNLEYKVGKAVFSTNLFETEHFKITYKATKSHISLNLSFQVASAFCRFWTTQFDDSSIEDLPSNNIVKYHLHKFYFEQKPKSIYAYCQI